MKKYILLLIIAIFPFVFASAATTPNVVSLDATAEKNTIKYNGEMEDGSFAVVCKLFDKDDKELENYSLSVDAHKFNGEFIVQETGDYTIKCAHYEGGTFKDASVTVTEIAETTASLNAKTGDIVMLYVAMLIVGVVGAVAGSVYLVKKSK